MNKAAKVKEKSQSRKLHLHELSIPEADLPTATDLAAIAVQLYVFPDIAKAVRSARQLWYAAWVWLNINHLSGPFQKKWGIAFTNKVAKTQANLADSDRLSPTVLAQLAAPVHRDKVVRAGKRIDGSYPTPCPRVTVKWALEVWMESVKVRQKGGEPIDLNTFFPSDNGGHIYSFDEGIRILGFRDEEEFKEVYFSGVTGDYRVGRSRSYMALKESGFTRKRFAEFRKSQISEKRRQAALKSHEKRNAGK